MPAHTGAHPLLYGSLRLLQDSIDISYLIFLCGCAILLYTDEINMCDRSSAGSSVRLRPGRPVVRILPVAPRIPDTLSCAGDSFCATGEDSNRAAAHSAASKATARLCLACGCQPVGMSNKRNTVHPGKNRTVLKPVKHIRVLVFLFSVRREDSSYPFLFFIQMRYSPSVMRVSRYRMGVQHASRMGMGRLPVA